MNKEIITMGSINQDIFINAKEYPNYGDTVWVDSVNTQPGGKGANQAIALSRIGSQVRFIGAVGDDEQGKNMLKNLTDQKIDTTNIQIKENVNTGTFVVILDEQGENTMLGTVGANNKIKLDPITEIFNSVNANYFLLQLETNEDAIMHALKIAKEKNINVILDPAPADGYKEAYLSYANIITPNKQEAEKISGIKITDKETALTAATIINKKGVNTVILKLGELGSLIYTNEQSTFISSYKVKAINTVGAGDVFAAALTVYLNEGNQLVESVKFATAAAAIKVSKRETQNALPTKKEIKDFINNYS